MMRTNLKSFKSDRKFSVFSYSVGHGPLLLRSGRTDEHHTRIDVLILDVRAVEIRSWFEGFEIALVDHDYLREFRSRPTEMMEPGLNAYSISGKEWQGFIVGGTLYVHEDEADFTAPSAFAAANFVGQEKGWRENEATEAARPTDAEVEAAARVLDKAGRHHHWWSKTIKSYDEFAKTDPIAKSEFEGLVEQMLMAASEAKRNTGTS
jgi:hypothetical protein